MEMTTFSETTSPSAKTTLGASAPETLPAAVVQDAIMTLEEKRSVLASWASDLHAVPNRPALRRVDDNCVVEFDDILDSLRQPDEPFRGSKAGVQRETSSRRGCWSGLARVPRRGRDDDDDPPTPAPAAVRPWSPVLDGGAAVAA
jgi:hypothetical protein